MRRRTCLSDECLTRRSGDSDLLSRLAARRECLKRCLLACNSDTLDDDSDESDESDDSDSPAESEPEGASPSSSASSSLDDFLLLPYLFGRRFVFLRIFLRFSRSEPEPFLIRSNRPPL